LLGFQISPSTFPFFFFFFDKFFFFFFIFLKRTISTWTQKLSDCKINALKIERVRSTFENLNSYKMALKILKMMQIYQNIFFWGFLLLFYYFLFFKKIIKNMNLKLSSNKNNNDLHVGGFRADEILIISLQPKA
jgi:hypothetical protein